MHHNVLADDINDDKMKYKKFGKVSLSNNVSLSHSINGPTFILRTI